jgi:hypothetical protein
VGLEEENLQVKLVGQQLVGQQLVGQLLVGQLLVGQQVVGQREVGQREVVVLREVVGLRELVSSVSFVVGVGVLDFAKIHRQVHLGHLGQIDSRHYRKVT